VATWRDGKAARVEDRLNDVVVGLLVAVEKNRKWQEEERRREEQHLLAERVRMEGKRLAEIERARVSDLERMTERWHKARRLSSFIDAVKEEATRRRSTIETDDGFARWLEWAAQHARSLDPLAATRPLPSYRFPEDQRA
jgi:hypothetical protein